MVRRRDPVGLKVTGGVERELLKKGSDAKRSRNAKSPEEPLRC